VKAAFAVNLTRGAKVEASNVRGNAKEFDATHVTDNDKNTYWATDDEITTPSLTFTFDRPTTLNRFAVEEYIRLGQRVKAFTVEALVEGNWKELAQGTTIGYRRILRFPSVTTTRVRFRVTDSKSCPLLSNIGLYNAPQILDAPAIIRSKSGEIHITPVDGESVVYYSVDGSTPTTNSAKYAGPVLTDGKIEVRAIACEPSSGKCSAERHESFDRPRKEWRIVGITDEKANAVLDGDPSTAWHLPKETKLPGDLVIDLGAEETLLGFRYFPDQALWGPGIITNYQFFVSLDTCTWKLVSEGEFSNIKNNPLWQIKKFAPEKARYIKLRALKNTEANNNIGYAEIDMITE
jgi:alpha-L-fucosidase